MKKLVSILLCLALLFSVTACTNQAEVVEEQNVQAEDEVAVEENTQPELSKEEIADLGSLISAEELNKIKDQVVIIDYSEKPKELVPGAIWVDRSKLLVQVDDENQWMIQTKENFEKIIGEYGINNDDTIVIYCDADNLWAARLWWEFKVFGHEDVKLLDGGLRGWKSANFEVVKEAKELAPTTYTAKDMNMDIYATFDYVVENIGNDDIQFFDDRTMKEWNAGRIPGAIHLEYTDLINEKDGTYLSKEDAEELILNAGFDPEKETITYCLGGIRAAHTAFLLTEVLGWEDVKVYDGSWSQYGQTDAPVEK